MICVSVDFVVGTFSLFDGSHRSSELLYSGRCIAALSGFECCVKLVMLAAYEM